MRNLKVIRRFSRGNRSALLCAVLLGVWLLVNPNAYKGRIVAAVKESTGRELKLPGDIKLSVMPWVALELGPASLGNPPGFGDEPFLSFAHATVRVRLLPLLRKRLEVARVEVDGLDLRLRKNAQARAIGRAPNPTQPATADADHTAMQPAPSPRLRTSAFKTARLAYEGITLEKLNLETGSLAADRAHPHPPDLRRQPRSLGRAAVADCQVRLEPGCGAETAAIQRRQCERHAQHVQATAGRHTGI